MKFFHNIHSHSYGLGANERTLRSLMPEELNVLDDPGKIPPGNLFSVGIHPKFIGKLADLPRKFAMIGKISETPLVAAIGECGLDRFSYTDLNLQKEVFIKHAEMAEKAEKPLIIHCVRAYPELIAIKNLLKPKHKWIIHGFIGSEETAQQLVKHQFMLSFGAALRNSQKLAGILREVPLEYVFLETDDSEGKIEDLYLTASEIRKDGVDYIQDTIAKSAEIFGNWS